MHLGNAFAPDGLRLYAIGDVHGCDDLLSEVHQKIATDLAADAPADHRIIHLGDYVDRGSQSAAVIERLSRMVEENQRVLCLRGNHEEMLLDFLANGLNSESNFLINGGIATLASYGIGLDEWNSQNGEGSTVAEIFSARLPAHHRGFVEGLAYSARFGDYFFCHAGVRPEVALDRQDTTDLTWIRKSFTNSAADFGAVVIHGHTPVPAPEVRPNRINVDTGAVLGGPLTCLVLEGKSHRFL